MSYIMLIYLLACNSQKYQSPFAGYLSISGESVDNSAVTACLIPIYT